MKVDKDRIMICGSKEVIFYSTKLSLFEKSPTHPSVADKFEGAFCSKEDKGKFCFWSRDFLHEA